MYDTGNIDMNKEARGGSMSELVVGGLGGSMS